MINLNSLSFKTILLFKNGTLKKKKSVLCCSCFMCICVIPLIMKCRTLDMSFMSSLWKPQQASQVWVGHVRWVQGNSEVLSLPLLCYSFFLAISVGTSQNVCDYRILSSTFPGCSYKAACSKQKTTSTLDKTHVKAALGLWVQTVKWKCWPLHVHLRPPVSASTRSSETSLWKGIRLKIVWEEGNEI